MYLGRKTRGDARCFTRGVYTAVLLSLSALSGSAIASPNPSPAIRLAQTTSGKASQPTRPPSVSEAVRRDSLKSEDKGVVKTPLDERLILRDWQCVTTQPMMELNATDVFTQDHLSKSEGKLMFTWTGGTTLHLFLETASRWRIDGGQLCDVPVSMHFTQVSGESNPYVDKLLAAMQSQADNRIKGKLESCRVIQSLTGKELVLALPASQGTILTRCTPNKASKNEK